ncbi:hypothetical protein [Methylobacterium frigidaeris]|uniref:Uncharacterized protein n=1 Tax=Methylobacterium frigidaeris TaxID=2038277 RepID=A0AA37M2X6_9HYPH|nr:hypothetical protein MPEAHAMD_0896 [Methylobacterium frigidaeris]
MIPDDTSARPRVPTAMPTSSQGSPNPLAQAWDDRIARLLDLLPKRVGDSIAWLRAPSRRWVRIPAALLLILGGFLAILPIFGLWMLPLGLALLSEDLPGMKPALERSARWLAAKWARVVAWWRGRR